MKFFKLIFLCGIILTATAITVSGQNKRATDTTKKTIKDNKSAPNKTSVLAKDTTKKDNSLGAEIKTVADSTVYDDNDAQILYLYGNAKVTYGDFNLDANYIKVNKRTHVVYSSGSYDPKTHKYIGRPISKQGKDEPLESDSLLFNYETKKGKLWNPKTKQQENYITHGQAKVLNDEEVAYKNVTFTTCDKPDPDFGIVITRGIGEKKQIISGPAYLEIEGVPLPIGVPFAFLPKTESRTSGVILPEPGEDARLGFFLRGFGYYLGISDYMDLTTTGSYYTNNSYELNTQMTYLDRYRYSGNLSLSYGSHNYGLPGDKPAKDFNITWSHSQNQATNPGTTFSASVNAGTSTFYQNNPATTGYNLQSLTQNSLRSSIAYGRTWTGTPFNFTASLSHSQDLTNKTVTLELPTFTFGMSTINPFDSKERVGEQKWYQKITVGYTLNGTNRLNAIPESQLFQSNTLTKKLQNGLNHQIPIGLNLNVLTYFQFNANVTYAEQWYFQSIRKHYAKADSLVIDTIPGFQRAGEYNLSAGLSTKVYGMLQFKKGSIQAIRHVMTPTISFSYRPDYTSLNYSFNKSIVSTATVPYPVISSRYSIFEQGVYGGPTGQRQAGLNFSLSNTLEAKVRRKSTDTAQTDKKITLLQDLTLGTFYNFAADSLKLSPISITGHTSFFHDRLSLSFGAQFNPYSELIVDSVSNGLLVRTARTINRYSLQDGHFPTLTSFNISAGISLNPQTFRPQQKTPNTMQGMNAQQAQRLSYINGDPDAYVDFNVPYNISLNYAFSYSNSYISTSNTNTLSITGDLSLTKNWKVSASTNYDFRVQQFASATQFTINRNLHCWSLSASWIPFGYYKSYNVTLRANSSILQDLKLTKKTDYTTSQYFTP